MSNPYGQQPPGHGQYGQGAQPGYNQYGQGTQPGYDQYGQGAQPGQGQFGQTQPAQSQYGAQNMQPAYGAQPDPGQYGNAQPGGGIPNSSSKKEIKLSLSLKAVDLKNLAGAFKGWSDPYATVTLFSYRSHTPQVIGKTEVVKNSLNPDWVKTFPLDYELGSNMNVVVNIFDEVRKGKNIGMGSASFDVSALLGAKGNTMAVKMKKGGKIIARVDKPKGSGTLRLKMNGIKLKNVEDAYFGKSDPFFQLMRKNIGKNGEFEWDTVFRSNVVKDNLNPSWAESTINLSVLCDGDLDAPLKLLVADNESDGKHIPMGQTETTVNEIVRAKNSNGFYLLNTKGKAVGNLVVTIAEVRGHEKKTKIAQPYGNVAPSAPPPPNSSMGGPPRVSMVATSLPIPSFPVPSPTPFTPAYAPPRLPQASFADYMSGGCEMQLCVAIDFTGSNGDPRQPGTLHHQNPNPLQHNDYEKAILGIGHVLANYDTDGQFPVWGFGAKYGGQVYHLFQCGPTAEVHGVNGIIEAYHQTFQSGLIMSSPTVITQVIETAGAFAKKGQADALQVGKSKYTILLILTDGAVSDIHATVASINANSDAPLSIVIVGIGNADFSSMQHLDDGVNGRDIVQFVEFNRHKHDVNSLTHETLSEVPEQLVGYFQKNNIPPAPAVQIREEEIVVVAQEEEIDLNFNHDANGNVTVSGGGYTPVRVY